jgi:glycosyltransferase involved in cell wall biosynthesis
MPSFDNAFYGGIMTILRLAAHLQQADEVRQRVLICGSCDPQVIAGKIADAFPVLQGIEVRALDSASAIEAIPPADYSVATLWTTAYVALKVQNTGYKFYMIQDYEPLFYPAGSTFAQAELTYRFGFYGIANTQSLRDIYEQEYGGRAVVLSPSVDTRVFYPGPDLATDGRLRLFYYARPGVPRNGFELAVAALRLVKQRMGERVEIVCAGQAWNPSEFGLNGLVHVVGMLPYAKTGDLYRNCHAGLAMMMTRHPSYLPFEMMACGTLVVANRNSANTWLLRDRENCLIAEPTASCLADTLIDALENYASYAPIRRRAAEHIQAAHGDWTVTMCDVAKFMHRPDPSGASV